LIGERATMTESVGLGSRATNLSLLRRRIVLQVSLIKGHIFDPSPRHAVAHILDWNSERKNDEDTSCEQPRPDQGRQR
jgi:hypothetical protein